MITIVNVSNPERYSYDPRDYAIVFEHDVPNEHCVTMTINRREYGTDLEGIGHAEIKLVLNEDERAELVRSLQV